MPPESKPPAVLRTSALRSDGSLNVERVGLRREAFRDLYHTLLTVSWPGLLGVLAALYFVINAVFAALYLLGGECIANARPGSFVDAYEFSVQTFATIGYGVFSPQTPWAHAVVSVEALAGIVYSAFATGLMFSKFARPSARVIFATRPVVSMFDGVPMLQLRIANGRFNQIFEASAKLRMSKMELTREGQSLRRFRDLRLEREQNPILSLSWTLFHRIDESSPLFGLSPEALTKHEALFILMVSGTDETVVQTVHARKMYYGADLAWDHKYVDIMESRAEGGLAIHYERFHDVVPADEEHQVLRRLFPDMAG